MQVGRPFVSKTKPWGQYIWHSTSEGEKKDDINYDQDDDDAYDGDEDDDDDDDDDICFNTNLIKIPKCLHMLVK